MSKELKEVSEEDRIILRHIKKGKLHPLTTKCYQDLLKKQKTLEFIKENIDISVQAYQGGYYLLVGGDFRGAKPISKETYNLLTEVLA